MKVKIYFKILTVLFMIIFIYGCESRPRDKTHLDDIFHCGFGQEYVSGYVKSNGKKVNGYCRDKN
jgi:hypothetical protein